MLNSSFEMMLSQAIEFHQAGRHSEAENLYTTIVTSSSVLAVASYGLGLIRASEGRLSEAINAYSYAIKIEPSYINAYINLGSAFLANGQHDQALVTYQKALLIKPDNATVLGNLGKVLQDLGRPAEALAFYRQAIVREPDNAVIWSNFGAALLEQHAWQDCAMATRRAVALDPDNALAYANLAAALLHTGEYENALNAAREACALQPNYAPLLASAGGVMLELGAWEEAASACQRAIDLDSSRPDAHFNLSHACKALNRLDTAEAAARQAIVICPDSANYHFHLAHILLLNGNFEAGWAEYEWRWKQPDFAWLEHTIGRLQRPLWNGEDISDKAILICTEQGIGDIVQFARYIPLVKQRARQVIVAASSVVRKILQSIEGIEVVSLKLDQLPPFDVYCPLLSLPRVFGTCTNTIPANVPYLHPTPDARARWFAIAKSHILRVGIVWAGNPATKRDRFRSPGLSSVMPLFSIQGVQFIVLQKGAGRQDCVRWPLPPNVIDLGPELADLSDTAAVMSGLDLVISSCTGPLHLAGALGVPIWGMIPFAPYFPWLLERTDSPWYPTLRLYRQNKPGQNWSDVVSRIASDLITYAGEHSASELPII